MTWGTDDPREKPDDRTAQLERQLAIMKKAARLDIAARLYAADVTNGTGLHAESPSQTQRRRYAFEQAELLIAENEARP